MSDQPLENFDDEQFSTDMWTQKELLKHVYRELMSLKVQVSKYINDKTLVHKVEEIDRRLFRIENEHATTEKMVKRYLAIGGIVISIISIFIASLPYLAGALRNA